METSDENRQIMDAADVDAIMSCPVVPAIEKSPITPDDLNYTKPIEENTPTLITPAATITEKTSPPRPPPPPPPLPIMLPPSLPALLPIKTSPVESRQRLPRKSPPSETPTLLPIKTSPLEIPSLLAINLPLVEAPPPLLPVKQVLPEAPPLLPIKPPPVEKASPLLPLKSPQPEASPSMTEAKVIPEAEPNTSKVNGDHIFADPQQNLFNSEDESCSSSDSSSLHNLVIDQPDEESLPERQSDNGSPPSMANEKAVNRNIQDQAHSRKRKLSTAADYVIELKKPNIEENGNEEEVLNLVSTNGPLSDKIDVELEVKELQRSQEESAEIATEIVRLPEVVPEQEVDRNKKLWRQEPTYTDFRQMFQGFEASSGSEGLAAAIFNEPMDLSNQPLMQPSTEQHLPNENLVQSNEDLQDLSKTAEPVNDGENVANRSEDLIHTELLPPIETFVPKNSGQKDEHIQEYAQYLGLKPAVRFKCFKCQTSTFEDLLQLRDHQKLCLFKENRRNSSHFRDSLSSETVNLSSNHSGSDLGKTTSLNDAKNTELNKRIDSLTTAKAKKKVFLCSACGTYYEGWNLFLHMREVHKRHICLYCVGMFPSAERLTLHLEMKHDLEQNHFDCQERLLRSSRDSCYLMCCTCEHLFTEQEEFSDHVCNDLIQPCQHCGQKGKHAFDCKTLQIRGKPKHKEKQKRKNRPAGSSKKSSGSDIRRIDQMPLGNFVDNLTNSGILLREESKTATVEPLRIKLNGLSGDNEIRRLEPAKSVPEEPPDEDHIDGSDFHQPIIENPSVFASQQQQIYAEHSTNSKEAQDNINNNTNHERLFTGYDFEHKFSSPLPVNPMDSNSNFGKDVQSTEASHADEVTTEDSQNSSRNQITDIEENNERPPLFVPKFKIKIPKEFQTPIESEHSSTESDDEDLDQSMEIAEEEESPSKDEEEAMDEDANNQSEELVAGGQEEEEVIEEPQPDQPMEEANEPEIEEPQLESQPIEEVMETPTDQEPPLASPSPSPPLPAEVKKQPPADGIEVADEDTQTIELMLNQPLDRFDKVEFLRICLRYAFPFCLYCNHARRIAVNGQSFALHLIGHHRFSATVDSITAEELQPDTIVTKLKTFIDDMEDVYFNLESYNSEDKENLQPYEKIFECFQCRFETRIHKELYLHNRKMHLKTAILCFMCRLNFFSYSELLCHMCPGVANKVVGFDVQFQCCLCEIDRIPSAFRLMVHLRKKHFACDVCLEDCQDQSRLSSHAWKHKLHHLCYRCGIAYRNKPDITKHLFWKHGTESVLCKRCLQKRWPHVYHFCIPPATFVCEVCSLIFTRAMSLKVHKRLHSGDAPYPCTEDNCEKKFISRKLLLKHVARHADGMLEENNTDVVTKEEPSAVEPVKMEGVENEEKTKESTEQGNTSVGQTVEGKKKRKKSKKDSKENIDDLMNLPAPNLSESDSSDDSENERAKGDGRMSPMVPKVMLSPPSDGAVDDEDSNSRQIIDIWENFKTFQASQAKNNDADDLEEPDLPPPILHVAQSDHDYCMTFKPINQLTKAGKEEVKEENKSALTTPKKEPKMSHSPKKKQKSPRKTEKSGSDSSSSGSSSSSDSSCSCGSNCSCSNSGSSSDSSSSSDDSDSSSSEARRRVAARRAAKQEKRNRMKSENSSKANNSDIVDVVTSDNKPHEVVNPDDLILETDLETEESETDEDFYDEHPQKLADLLLAEKRRQLMLQTSMSPSHNFDIVENSRPSTPSLPEEMVKEKKVKIKKRKKDRKATKNHPIPTFKLNIPSILGTSSSQDATKLFINQTVIQDMLPVSVPSTPIAILPPPPPPAALTLSMMQEEEPHFSVTSPIVQQPSLAITSTPTTAAPITSRIRLSTGSNSDADTPLKRSKRRRRPNKFYGYSSDDDNQLGNSLAGSAAFKPTPPPNLTWRKEDLPTPSKSSSHKSTRSPALTSRKHHYHNHQQNSQNPSSPQALPPIPPLIIRPSAIQQSRMSIVEPVFNPLAVQRPPPVVESVRVPPVPVHHVPQPQPPQQLYASSSKESADESESSDEDKLHIHATPLPSTRRMRQTMIPSAPAPAPPPPQPQQFLPVAPLPSKPQMPPVSRIPPALLPNPDAERLLYFQHNHIRYPVRPPAGARPPREGESVYCYCRCPYDEVSEMIACDGDDCVIEWFHFECIGILVPPKGKWFCPECKPHYPNEVIDDYT